MAIDSGHSVFTIQDLLRLEPLRDAEVTVAAGVHRLGNEVDWVHVFETPYISDVLRGGEFLLTTGIGLTGMSPPEIDALVAALARSGAAGIGFEPSHAGAGLLTAPCRHHDLPLVIFGHDVRFVDVTHAVHERLVSRELGTLRRAVALQTQLRDAAREGLGPSGLVSALSDVLGAQVLLERSRPHAHRKRAGGRPRRDVHGCARPLAPAAADAASLTRGGNGRAPAPARAHAGRAGCARGG